MTKTPRTDQVWAQSYDPDYAVNGIPLDFAQKLETELNEMGDLMTHRMEQRDEAEKQLNELMAAARKLAFIEDTNRCSKYEMARRQDCLVKVIEQIERGATTPNDQAER